MSSTCPTRSQAGTELGVVLVDPSKACGAMQQTPREVGLEGYLYTEHPEKGTVCRDLSHSCAHGACAPAWGRTLKQICSESTTFGVTCKGRIFSTKGQPAHSSYSFPLILLSFASTEVVKSTYMKNHVLNRPGQPRISS